MMDILVIEDERPLALAVIQTLTRAGWNVSWQRDGHQGLEAAKAGHFHAIVLDVLLPGLNGLEVCAGLRTSGVNTPVLMLSALDEVEDRVMGLNVGADDYLSKPFDTKELVARVQALLRRDQTHKGLTIRIADLVIDRYAHTVKRGEQTIWLTAAEFALLETLAANEGKEVTREDLGGVAAFNPDPLSDVVGEGIASLRRKLDDPYSDKFIHSTVAGYRFESVA